MPLILINGISTAGKSSVAAELQKRGYASYDLEHLPSSGWYSKRTNERAAGFGEIPDRSPEWLSQHEWRVSTDDIESLSAQATDQTIFICGGAANEDEIAKLCDAVIWLKTDEATIRQRVNIPRDHDYGTRPHELDLIIKSNAAKEKRQRQQGSTMIDARQPLDAVIESVLEVAKNVHKKYPPVVVVDENDNEIGFEMLSTVWEQGLYHRIVSVFVEDFDGNMLLQLRGPGVKVYPNCWDQAAGGHVDKGYTYEQTAINETREELGIEVDKLQFTELGTHRTSTKENGRIINQFERAYLVKIARNTKLKRQADEVSKLQWFTPTELKNQKAQNPEKFTPGLLYCLEKYFSSSRL